MKDFNRSTKSLYDVLQGDFSLFFFLSYAQITSVSARRLKLSCTPSIMSAHFSPCIRSEDGRIAQGAEGEWYHSVPQSGHGDYFTSLKCTEEGGGKKRVFVITNTNQHLSKAGEHSVSRTSFKMDRLHSWFSFLGPLSSVSHMKE